VVRPSRPLRPSRPASLALALAWVYAALVLYASVYPFAGWRWPPGQPLLALAALPWGVRASHFDVWSNALGYWPLGLLLTLWALRRGQRQAAAAAWGILAPACLSFGCEVLQNFVPTRVPSANDWVLNCAGAAMGTALALALHRRGLLAHWQAFRQRWFSGDAAVALALLALWPLALMSPTPVPLGVGQIGGLLREAALAVTEGVPWAEPFYFSLLGMARPGQEPLPVLAEGALMTLGWLAPCMVAFSVVAPGWRRLALVGALLLTSALALTLSTLLNFGPAHALAWARPGTVPALLAAALLAGAAAPLGRLLVAGLGLMVLMALVLGVAQAPADPYFELQLQAWEQGRFIRFHGVVQWVTWLWPFAAMAWLLSRLVGRRLAESS
jgi:VanZ family protein